MGDHGFHLGDLGIWTKHTNYEQANRIPLLISAPGITKAGTSTRQLAESVDVFPTLTELAGLPAPDVPQSIDGISLVPVLRDSNQRLRDHAYHVFPKRKLGRAIRTERYRLVQWLEIGKPEESAEYELYDYEVDPLERRNLVLDHPDVVAELKQTLSTYQPPVANGGVEQSSVNRQSFPIQAKQATLHFRDQAGRDPSRLKSHDRALYIKAGWIRDPYIVLGPDDYYYLTGTQPRADDPREVNDRYNTGLEGDSIVGDQVRLWRSRDLIEWESQGPIFTVNDTQMARNGREITMPLIWAPEVHWIPELGDQGRWALLHCPAEHCSLALSPGRDLRGPWTHPMGDRLGKHHDPSMFLDNDGVRYLLWGNTLLAPLSRDLSRFTDKPTRIDPSSRRLGPDGKPINRIGHEGATMIKINGKYVHLGTAWSTDRMRQGSYNLYYCVADQIQGPYGPRRFVGRFLGHGTPFQDRDGKWWCTAFFNANNHHFLAKRLNIEISATMPYDQRARRDNRSNRCSHARQRRDLHPCERSGLRTPDLMKPRNFSQLKSNHGSRVDKNLLIRLQLLDGL